MVAGQICLLPRDSGRREEEERKQGEREEEESEQGEREQKEEWEREDGWAPEELGVRLFFFAAGSEAWRSGTS